MSSDPIVEEIHRVRRQLLTQSKGDLRKVIDGAAWREKGGGRVVLEAAPRAPAAIARKVSKRKLQAY